MFNGTAGQTSFAIFPKPVLTALLIALAALASVLAFAPGVARAGLSWCAGDPILDLEGQRVSVVVYVPPDQLANIDGDVEVQITVPKDTDVKVVFVDETYFTQHVTIVKRGSAGEDFTPVKVDVRVPSYEGRFDVAMSVTWPGEDGASQEQWVFGSSGSWMKYAFNLPSGDRDDD